VRGASIDETSELRWQSPETPSLSTSCVPESSIHCALLPVAVDADSPAVGLEVRADDEDRWLQVLHAGLHASPPAAVLRHEILLTRHELGRPRIGRGLSQNRALGPVPQLVTGVAVRSNRRIVESE
jgi:hypothetical protein